MNIAVKEPGEDRLGEFVAKMARERAEAQIEAARLKIGIEKLAAQFEAEAQQKGRRPKGETYLNLARDLRYLLKKKGPSVSAGA